MLSRYHRIITFSSQKKYFSQNTDDFFAKEINQKLDKLVDNTNKMVTSLLLTSVTTGLLLLSNKKIL
jgi:hypothetical protein